MKRYFLDDAELNWGGFLIDLDVRDTLPLFKKAKVTQNRSDPETVHEAWDESRTVVTANEDDFIRYTLEHSKRDSGKTCQDGWGLLIVPSEKILRDRLIPRVKNGVKINGVTIPWATVAYANLCVSLNADGSVGVRRFRRCAHCPAITGEWYVTLPEISRRTRRSQARTPAWM